MYKIFGKISPRISISYFQSTSEESNQAVSSQQVIILSSPSAQYFCLDVISLIPLFWVVFKSRKKSFKILHFDEKPRSHLIGYFLVFGSGKMIPLTGWENGRFIVDILSKPADKPLYLHK